MKLYKLTSKDYSEIREIAIKLYTDNSVTHDYFTIECHSQATLRFITSKKLILKDGELYEEKTKKDI